MPSPSAIVQWHAADKAASAQEKAAEEAAAASVRAAEIASETTREMYETGRKDIAPWRAAGMYGLEKLVGAPIAPALIDAPDKEDYYTTRAVEYPDLTRFDMATLAQMVRDGDITEDEYFAVLGARMGGRISAKDSGAALAPMPYTKKERVLDKVAYNKAMADYRKRLAEAETTMGPGLLELGPGEFEESPGYQFQFGEGLRALEHSAVGKKLSPSTAKAMMRYGEGLASTEYDKFLNRYYKSLDPFFNLAGLGQTAAGQMGAGAITTGTNLANIGMTAGQAQALAAYQAGQARASGYINQANAIAGGLDQYRDAAMMMYGGGGFG